MSTIESSPTRKRFSSVYAKITELEKEVDRVQALEMAGERDAKRTEALENSVARLKSLLKDARNVIDEYLQLHRDNGGIEENGHPRPYRRGVLNHFFEKALQICGTRIPDADDENDHHGDDLHGGDDDAISASGSEILGLDGDDQSRMSRVSQIAPELEVKKTFLQWLEVEKTASDHKKGVVKLGTRLSHMVLDFFFLVSNGGDILGIVETFKAALDAKSRLADKKSSLVVFDMFFKLLEFAEEEARKFERIGSESSTALVIGNPEKEGLADKFAEQILNLEAFLNRMLMSRHAIADTMRVGLEECWAELDSVGAEVSQKKLLLLSSLKEEPESVAALRKRMESKARELWGGFGSDKKED